MTTKKKPTPTKSSKPKKPSAAISITAQSAPAIGLMEADLNPREVRVLTHLRAVGTPQTQADIAKAVFAGIRPVTKAKSWARNTLRRLVREKFVKKAGGAKAKSGFRVPGAGTYQARPKKDTSVRPVRAVDDSP